ncbi:hypothetical protein HDV02_005253, partial [Globomyces sp. JEL0801]
TFGIDVGKNIANLKTELSMDISNQLEKANSAFRTNIQELTLSSLVTSLNQLSNSNQSIRIFMEGHGREPWNDTMDISRTVGWFTSLFPVVLSFNADYKSQLMNVKQVLRQSTSHGISYNESLVNQDQKVASQLKSELRITFNYLGRFQGSKSANSFFKKSTLVKSQDSLIVDSLRENVLITCFHSDGKLGLSITFDGSIDKRLISNWLDLWKQEMSSLIIDLSTFDSIQGLTHSDFSLLPLNVSMTEVMENTQLKLGQPLDQILDIYPATPLQEGLISSMLLNSSEYVIQDVWKVTGELDCQKFKSAWKKVAELHNSLRTTFMTISTGIFQVVWKEDLSEWTYSNWSSEYKDTLFNQLKQDRERGFTLENPSLVRFHIASGNEFVIIFTIHHSIIDGWSTPIAISFKRHVESVLEMDSKKAEQYWSHHLEGANYKSSPFALIRYPESSKHGQQTGTIEYNEKCVLQTQLEYHVTLNTILRLSWALVLRQYVCEENVVFGTIVSGRDSGIKDVEGCVGLLISTIPIHVKMNANAMLSSVLQELQSSYIESLPHVHASLVDIKKWSSCPTSLFDTLFIYQNYPTISSQKSTTLKLQAISPNEIVPYPITLTVSTHQQKIHYQFLYNPQNISTTQILNLTKNFENAFHNIINTKNRPIKEMSKITNYEAEKLLNFGTGPVKSIDYECAHYAF